MDCLICLPDKSGNFLVFRVKTAQNTEKSEKTGFGMAITARLGPVFCVFGPKISRTFYFKLTEQSSRKKLAEGGFEPEKVRLLYPAPEKKQPLSLGQRLFLFSEINPLRDLWNTLCVWNMASPCEMPAGVGGFISFLFPRKRKILQWSQSIISHPEDISLQNPSFLLYNQFDK